MSKINGQHVLPPKAFRQTTLAASVRLAIIEPRFMRAMGRVRGDTRRLTQGEAATLYEYVQLREQLQV